MGATGGLEKSIAGRGELLNEMFDSERTPPARAAGDEPEATATPPTALAGGVRHTMRTGFAWQLLAQRRNARAGRRASFDSYSHTTSPAVSISYTLPLGG